jgi:MGT family glycosyltransferase
MAEWILNPVKMYGKQFCIRGSVMKTEGEPNLGTIIEEQKLVILEPCLCGNAYITGKSKRNLTYLVISLAKEVDQEALNRSLLDTELRYPLLKCGVIRIGEWFYYVRSEIPSQVRKQESGIILNAQESGYHAFGVSMDGDRIVVCADHALLDGGGLMRVTDYLMERYEFHTGEISEERISSGSYSFREEADPWLLCADGDWLPVPGLKRRFWEPVFEEKDDRKLLELTVPTRDILTLCKEIGTTVSVLFLLLLQDAFQTAFPETAEESLLAGLPVDFRKEMDMETTLKNASFTCFIDLNDDRWQNRSFEEKAVLLKKQIKEFTDIRNARGWLRFLKSFQKSVTGTAPALDSRFPYSFMLSYLRPSSSGIYDGKELLYAGVRLFNDITLLEYSGHFHVYFREFQSKLSSGPPSFRNALTGAFANHGLNARIKEARGISPVSGCPQVLPENLPPSVFVFVNPFPGHTGPLLPLIRALAERGLQVRVYSGFSMKTKVEEAGGTLIGLEAFFEKGYFPKTKAYGFPGQIELAANLDEMIRMDVETFRPLLSIVDTESIWGRLLALKYRLHYVMSSATQVMNLFTIADDWREFFKELEPYDEIIEKMLSSLTAKGFPKRTLLSLLCPGDDTDCIVYIPERMQRYLNTMNREHLYYAGFSRYLKRNRAKTAGKERPYLYVSMGTYSSMSPWFFRSCITAFRDMDVDVLMAVWNHIDLRMLGDVPEHIRVVREADQAEVLKYADLAIFHAGLNTISDCLMMGVPMVLYPTVADQFANAKQIEALGAGLYIKDHRPAALRWAAQEVLSDPKYRRKAEMLGDEMLRCGGCDGAVDWILQRAGGEGES